MTVSFQGPSVSFSEYHHCGGCKLPPGSQRRQNKIIIASVTNYKQLTLDGMYNIIVTLRLSGMLEQRRVNYRTYIARGKAALPSSTLLWEYRGKRTTRCAAGSSGTPAVFSGHIFNEPFVSPKVTLLGNNIEPTTPYVNIHLVQNIWY